MGLCSLGPSHAEGKGRENSLLFHHVLQVQGQGWLPADSAECTGGRPLVWASKQPGPGALIWLQGLLDRGTLGSSSCRSKGARPGPTGFSTGVPGKLGQGWLVPVRGGVGRSHVLDQGQL
jgi:hypothetical protein